MDPHTKDMVMKKSPLKFVTVDRVGEAFELAAKEQRYQNQNLKNTLIHKNLIYSVQQTATAHLNKSIHLPPALTFLILV